MKVLTLLLVGSILIAAPRSAFADFEFGAPAFSFNSAALDDRAKAILVDTAVTLKRYPEYKLKIYGSRGQLESDTSISQRRLRSAQMFLIDSGIPGTRILMEDLGTSAPLQPNCEQADSREAYDAYNRNIQLQLVLP